MRAHITRNSVIPQDQADLYGAIRNSPDACRCSAADRSRRRTKKVSAHKRWDKLYVPSPHNAVGLRAVVGVEPR